MTRANRDADVRAEAVIFISMDVQGGVVLDHRGLHQLPIGSEDRQIIEANLRLFEASQHVKDKLAAQYMQQAAQDRLREQAFRLLQEADAQP